MGEGEGGRKGEVRKGRVQKYLNMVFIPPLLSHRFGASAGLMVMAFLPRPREPSSSE